MWQIFHDGGFGTFPTAIAGLLLLGVAARYAVRPESRWIPLQIALAVMTLSFGSASFVAGLITTSNGLSSRLEHPGLIGALGFGESLNNLAIALGLIAIASIATTVGTARIARQAATS
jgi:hypothetical protein